MTTTTRRRNPLLTASNKADRGVEAWPSMGNTSSQIVAACQQGDRNAQRQLYEQCCEMVFRLVNRMVGLQEAPDVVQQVFLQTFRTIGQFSGRSRFDTWLYRLAVNECLQFLRQAKRRSCERLAHEPADHSPEHARRVQHRELLERGLQRLDPDLRCIFLLREVEGLAYGEIAKVLEIPDGTVGSRLNRARADLKDCLIELGWEF
jgi:RNA polymerase sigma-70 factor (ECF subfamily)